MATDQSTLNGWIDFGCVCVFFLILRKKVIPVWALVIISAAGGALIA
jgi:hypothetical protein